MTATEAATLPRPVQFWPAADARGKYHATNPIVGTAACGAGVVLDTTQGGELSYPGGTPVTRVHRLCCRNCLRLAAKETPDGHAEA